MRQINLIYYGYTWQKGAHYTIQGLDDSTIDVFRPIFASTNWRFDGTNFSLKYPSNTSSTLLDNDQAKVGEIHQSCKHWDVLFDGKRFTLQLVKRGFVLKSQFAFIATLKVNAIGRITCTYANAAQRLTALLIYVMVNVKIFLSS